MKLWAASHGAVAAAAAAEGEKGGEEERVPTMERGEGITVGRFLNCFSASWGLSRELCCGEGADDSCWDVLYTRERCCASPGGLAQARCLRGVRGKLLACAEAACAAGGANDAVCDGFTETSPCAIGCGLPERSFYGFGVARSNSLGRTLGCLAGRPEVRSVMDLFLANGTGSADTLMDALARRHWPSARGGAASGSHSSTFIGFERDHETFWHAVRWLEKKPRVRAHTFRVTGAEGAEELKALAQRAAAAVRQTEAGSVAALLFEGEPYPDGGLSPTERLYAKAHNSMLRSLCEAISVDLVFLDGFASDAEFAVIQEVCRPLNWIVLNNVNLPGCAGWIREHLLTRPDWAEVLTGRAVDRYAAGVRTWIDEDSGGVPDVYRIRAWSALARVRGVCGDAALSSALSGRRPLAAAERSMLSERLRDRRNQWAGLGLNMNMPRGLIEEGGHLPEEIRWRMASNGRSLFNGEPVTRTVELVGAPYGTEVAQVGGGAAIAPLLRFKGARPIWDAALVGAMRSRQARGLTVSPPMYPHGASDVRLACDMFAKSGGQFAVWSSISPWVELILLGCGAEHVTTVDYNAPIIVGIPALHSLDQSKLADAHLAGDARFDLVISFSGLEHDGLGRYGDPINPEGDLAAMREIWLCLRPGGVLLLAVPVGAIDDVVYPYHRMYGPVRLPILVDGFEVLGRIWNGTLLRGGLENSRQPPTLWCSGRHKGPLGCGVKDWQHQPIIVLRRPSGLR